LGFLPRRSVPLRLYAGGSVVGGTGGRWPPAAPGRASCTADPSTSSRESSCPACA
jgi:hypothetical protein